MKNKKLKLISAAALLAASSTLMAQTRVNVAHLAPFSNEIDGTAVSVNVNGSEVLDNVVYQQVSGYLELSGSGVAPGMTTLDVFAPPGADTAAITAMVNLAADTDYTVAAIGNVTKQDLALLPLVDDNSAPADGNIKIRIVHAAPFADDLADTAVSIRLDTGEVVNNLDSVEFGASSGYFELPAGTYDLQVATVDGSTALIDLAPLDLAAGTIVTVFAVGDIDNQELGAQAVFADGTSAALGLEVEFSYINPGINGAWYNPDTSGQGFLFEVLPVSEQIFFAWYTYDTVAPAGTATAVIGAPEHRWFTGIGSYTSSSADMNVQLATGGIFDSDATVERDNEYGTLSVVFDSCSTAELTYSLTDSGETGTIPLTRIAGDNVALCESLLDDSETGAE